MSSTSRAWMVAASVAAVEVLKDQGFCRWNYPIRLIHQHAKNSLRSVSQAKKLSTSSSALVSSNNKVREEKAKQSEESMRKVINLRIVLNYEKISYVLDTPKPNIIPEEASEVERVTYQKWQDDDLSAKSYILASMSNELQRQHENMPDASSMIVHLQELYGEQSRTIRYEISKKLFRMRMTEGSVNEYVLKMIDYIEQLEALNFSMDGELAIDLILQSLPDSFSQFIMNFNINKMECSLAELLKMLNTTETCIKKPKDVMAIEGPSAKKGKKKKFQPKAKGGIKKGKANKPNDKGKCFHCGKDGH
ncbi:hypothetical protein WN943_010886 [Citrus x changshan-huyou]